MSIPVPRAFCTGVRRWQALREELSCSLHPDMAVELSISEGGRRGGPSGAFLCLLHSAADLCSHEGVNWGSSPNRFYFSFFFPKTVIMIHKVLFWGAQKAQAAVGLLVLARVSQTFPLKSPFCQKFLYKNRNVRLAPEPTVSLWRLKSRVLAAPLAPPLSPGGEWSLRFSGPFSASTGVHFAH